MTKVTDVTGAYHARLKAEREAMDELGYVDLVEEHRLLEQTKLLRDILHAYHEELQAPWKLRRFELKAALHRAFAAVEDDDLDALTAALLECAERDRKTAMRLALPYEDFATVARRLNLVPRVIVAQEAIEDGDPEEARGVLADLERELVRAIRENDELEEGGMTEINLGDLQAAIAELGNSAPSWLDQHEPRFAAALDDVLYYHPHLNTMAPPHAPEDTTAIPLSFVTFENFAAVDEPGAEPLVTVAGSEKRLRAAIASGSLLLAYGDGGAGKTTLLLDLALHLAAGIPWCGLLEPVRPLRIVWVENEGPRPMLREKIAAKLDTWTGPALEGRLQALEEPWGRFTFRDQRQRDQLVRALDTHDVDLVIAGPLGRIGMEGAGTSDEIRDFLGHVEAALSSCQRRPALAVVHHENKAGTVSGAWEREPDTLIHVQAQGHGRTRVFWAKARWASDLHATTSHLVWAPGESFTIDEKPEISDTTIADELLAAVLEIPGGSWSKLRGLVRGNDGEKAQVRDRLIAAGQLVNTAAREGHFNLWAPEDPAVPRADISTVLARASCPTPDGAPDPSRATVPYVSRHGARNGTGEPGSHIDQDEVERLAAIAQAEGLA